MRNSRLATILIDATGLETIPLKLRADCAACSRTGKQIAFRCHAVKWRDPITPFELCTSRSDGSRLKQFPRTLESVHPSRGTHS